jgi:hypothetical protein
MITYVALFLLLGLGHFVGTSSSTLCFGFAVGLGLSDLARYSLAPASARLPLGFLFLLFLILLFGRLGDFDDHFATVELLFIESLDSFLRGLCTGNGDKTIAR